MDYTGYDVLKYTIRDKNGNESEEATINIEVLGFFLPNTITPNGDGKNDTFRVLGTYKFDHVELEIINRFGQRIFYSADYKNDWVVPDNISDGTYFYTFKGMKNNEKPIVRKGFLLLVRKQSRH
ncbi:gliding motility-associated C-terminal domain-containing protein [Parapusillimonas sp. SGNA-6]|nr:gliding motility-associated C-terminal domain-containing protein [Parapusillimonas sp. SGNA-6]